MSMLQQVLKAIHRKPIAYHPVYRDLMGDTAGAVILSQILYWASRMDGEFWKTDAELVEETNCTNYEIRQAKAKMRSLPFISVEVRGLPPRTYYRVDWDALAEALAATESDRQARAEDAQEPEELEATTVEFVDGQQNNSSTFDKTIRRPSTKQFVEGRRNNSSNFDETISRNSTKQLVEGRRNPSTVPPSKESTSIAETTAENTTENTTENVQSSTGVPPVSDFNHDKTICRDEPIKGGQSEPKRQQLRLSVEAPKTPPKHPDYFREIVQCYRTVLGEDVEIDRAEVVACLPAWKRMREDSDGVRGLSPEEIARRWKEARAAAPPERRDRVTLLSVLNGVHERVAEYERSRRKQDQPAVRVVDETPTAVRAILERLRMTSEGGNRDGHDRGVA